MAEITQKRSLAVFRLWSFQKQNGQNDWVKGSEIKMKDIIRISIVF